ncbi:UDP-glucose/GDP-mannose dehydrogenase family protein [Candidatus Woesearchaeota archaeon]|nr:UDP-glucose/GDP-mannose dehydrogenase family protein [Candidatus Woesearchaeota archaeon]
MRISVIGCGYVGLVTGACLANLGNEVTCMDIDRERIEKLNQGILPFYEPGLRDLVELNSREGRLRFTVDVKRAVHDSDIIFIAVNTPSAADGSGDMSYVLAAAREIGAAMDSYKVVVVKSTVPVGSSSKIREAIAASQRSKLAFDVVSNPEFLREGEAVHDFMLPDRVIIGAESEAAKKIMIDIYKPIERTGRPIMVTDINTAELVKYVSNAMLATRISFMNEVSRLCEAVGADVKVVAKGIGLDSRIGPRFLQAGAGYGGSCFPKDVKALVHMLKSRSLPAGILDGVDRMNELQKAYVARKVLGVLGDPKGKKVAVWGLSFKPKTDDMRDAPSIVIISELQRHGVQVAVFDPVAMNNARKLLKNVEYASNPYEAAKAADCIVVVTEWDEFRELDRVRLKSLMNSPSIVDARNIYEPDEMRAHGFGYVGIGR